MSKMNKLLIACSCVALAVGLSVAGSYAPFHEILRANADGTNSERVLPRDRALAIGSIAIDPGLGPDPMYWHSLNPYAEGGLFPTYQILRAGLLGYGIRDIINHGSGPVHIDSGAAKVYYTYSSDCSPCDALARADLDGSNIEQILSDSVEVNGFDIDPTAGKIYWQGWFDFEEQRMWVVDFDGSNLQELFPSVATLNVAVDPTAQKLYWLDYHNGKIRRANLDGSGIEDVLDGLDGPSGLVLDPDSGRLWWSEGLAGTVSRANLDGSGATPILSGLDSPKGLAFLATNDPGGGKIYVVANPGEVDIDVPAVTDAGALALVLIVLTAATVMLIRRRASGSLQE